MADRKIIFDDALFVLDCGCILEGCSQSAPAQQLRAGIKGMLWCCIRVNWFLVTDMVSLDLNEMPKDATS